MSDSATSWAAAYQAPLSVGFSRQEYWSGQLFPSPGDLPNPGTEPRSSALQVDSLLSEPPGKLWNQTVADIKMVFVGSKQSTNSFAQQM